MRKCIVTRENRKRDEMIRFVLDPEGWVTPDLKANLPGRGVWVTSKTKYVIQAKENDFFARGFGVKIKRKENLEILIADLLTKASLDYLSMARKAGLAVTGFTKVKYALKGDCAVLIGAEDGAVDGKNKLTAMAHDKIILVDCFTCRQLSLALGRSNVIHAAIRTHDLADRFIGAVHRLKNYID